MGKQQAWFNVERSKHPAAQHSVAENKRALGMLLGCTIDHDLTVVDLHTLAERTAAYTVGLYTPYQLEDALGFCARLHRELGGFKQHARAAGVVSVRHMIVIEQVLRRMDSPLPPHRIPQLDAALVDRFTAHVPNQIVPTPGHVRRWLEDLLRGWGIEDETTPEPTPCETVLTVPSLSPGMTMLSAELPDLDANAIMDRVTAHANAHDLSKAKALLDLVCHTTEVERTIDRRILFGTGTIRPGDQVNTTWLYGTGPVTKQQRCLLDGVDVDFVNIHEIAKQCRATHDPTLHLRLAVQLRDLTCRFPGCTKPAHQCDIDHVINHEAGGWTTLSNLQCLCRKHHNAKTDRRVRAVMDALGSVTWFHADGTLIGTTTPNGPLAGIEGLTGGITTRHSGHTPHDGNTNPPGNNGIGRWGYTLAQKNRRIQRWRQQQHTAAINSDPPSALPPPPALTT
ncbi:HNH endonuclease signature motif containing protein [Corynebacterium sp.]|uniref:HNH endonuclease signature motif containing protein n=1 Tax=Corynebacterium sp. TaxID=1720 RepID=UPI0026DD794D|nr:HNH endonuclease signature motif containing protein [Corynebacterium sp.]MDO5077194.1 HNH endonuclease signature motif containing protein [Corynebacterium sp.]